MADRILVLDPGNSTGWVCADVEEGKLTNIQGGTAPENHLRIYELMYSCMPDIIVIESFKLFPGKAASMAWNSFYPVEVIGVVKYFCMKEAVELIEQAPSVKKYSGGFGKSWEELKPTIKITEHVKDAYLHLEYYLRNGYKKRRP